MKKKLFIIIPCFIIAILLISGLSFLHDKRFSTGYALIADNGSFLFIDDDGCPISMSNHTMSESAFEKLETGDKVLILQDEYVLETYPEQCGAYLCIRLEKGTAENIPSNTIEQLAELGWIDIEKTDNVNKSRLSH